MLKDRKGIFSCIVLVLLLFLMFSTIHPVHGWLQRTIHRDFHWSYNWIEYSWSLDIPVDNYIAYAIIPLGERLPEGQRLYGTFVTTEDPYLRSVAKALRDYASQRGFDYYDTANFILAFIQSLPYIPDDVSTPYDEFPKFPLETLIEGGGDCEDTSLLYATIMSILGYDVILISPPGHLMVGIGELGGIPREPVVTYFEYGGKRYFTAETTGEGWRVGNYPENLGPSAKLIRVTGEQIRARPIDIPKLIGEYKVLQRKYDELYQEHLSLQRSYDSLDVSYKELKSSYITIIHEYEFLKNNYQQVVKELEDMQVKYNAIQMDYNNLKDDFNDLRGKFNALKSDYDVLSQKYQYLKTSYDELEQDYKLLNSTLNAYIFAFYLAVIGLAILLIIFAIRYKHSYMGRR
ncbi:MAG: hypothetical protein QXE61_04610 [Nitrososphaerota archaeon]